MDADRTVRATHHLVLNQTYTYQLGRVGSRNQRFSNDCLAPITVRAANHRNPKIFDMATNRRHHEAPFVPALTARISGGMTLRAISGATGRQRWFDNAPQSLAQFLSSMKQSNLYCVKGNSHDSSGLFRRWFVKLAHLQSPACSVRQRFHGRGQNVLPLPL
jgi:hypothetical protein